MERYPESRFPRRVSVRARKRRLLKEHVLDAAEGLLANEGFQGLTLDGVLREADASAEEARLVFPSEKSLLDALVQRYLKVVALRERSIAGRLVDSSDGTVRNAELRASIIRLLIDDPGTDDLGIALLAAGSTVSGPLDRVRAALRLRFESFRSSPARYDMRSAIQLAVIGLTLLEMLKVFPLADPERRTVIAFLFQLASEEAVNDQ